MAEVRTAAALAAAGAAFAVGAFVASDLAPDTSADHIGLRRPPSVPSTVRPPAGDYARDWHTQTALASYQSRLLRYAQRDASFAGARFAFQQGVFLLYGAGS